MPLHASSPLAQAALVPHATQWPGEKQLAEKPADTHGKTRWIGLTLSTLKEDSNRKTFASTHLPTQVAMMKTHAETIRL